MLTTVALTLSVLTNGAISAVAFTNAKRTTDAPLQDLTLIRSFGVFFGLVAVACLLALVL